ncbi:Uncharacterised protein [Escherichia coli]|nr:Uncharacterised protein [Escherichia coli]
MSKQEGINTLSTQRSETILKNIHSLTDYGGSGIVGKTGAGSPCLCIPVCREGFAGLAEYL